MVLVGNILEVSAANLHKITLIFMSSMIMVAFTIATGYTRGMQATNISGAEHSLWWCQELIETVSFYFGEPTGLDSW